MALLLVPELDPPTPPPTCNTRHRDSAPRFRRLDLSAQTRSVVLGSPRVPRVARKSRSRYFSDQSVASHFHLALAGQTSDSWVVLIRRGQYLTAITTGAQQPFSPTFIRALAAAADRHLTAIAH